METKQFGLLGEHLSHSFSPQIHKALCGLDYTLFPTAPADLESFIQSKNYLGLNVTIPYKKAVISLCDKLSSTAERIGSVNTILIQEDGTLLGENTDYAGFRHLLAQAGAEIAGKKCLILGNGGVSPTVRVALEDQNAGEIITISRSGADNYDNLDRHYDAHIIVNTTPVGMYPNTGVSPVDLSKFPQCEGVYDLIYNPARTQLMLDAERLGIPTAGGLSMLVAQAYTVDQLFLNIEIPESRLTQLTEKMARDTKNIILIGMPGSGKSTIGRHLAAKLNRDFVDTDRLIEETCGTSIPTFFAEHGEEAFRKLEHEILVDVSRKSGLVIATGGGIVTRPENHDPLRQNSSIVFLQRDIDTLPTQGRPISQSVPIETLYEQRLPLYRALCDLEVFNKTGITDTINLITEGLSL